MRLNGRVFALRGARAWVPGRCRHDCYAMLRFWVIYETAVDTRELLVARLWYQ